MSYTEPDSKHKRINSYQKIIALEEEPKAIEETIREICNWSEPIKYDRIEKLVQETQSDLFARKNTMICTLVDCISNKPLKVSAYVTLIAYFNQKDEDFVFDLVESIALALQDALDEHQYNIASNIVLGLCDLINVNVVHISSVLSLLEAFIASASDSQTPSIPSYWILKTVIFVIPFIAETFEQHKTCREPFIKLIDSIPSIISEKKKEYLKAFRLWRGNKIIVEDECVEYIWKCVSNLRTKKWQTYVIDRPYEGIKDQFSGLTTHKFTIAKLSQNLNPIKFPTPQSMFKLFDQEECETFPFCNTHLPMFYEFERFYTSSRMANIVESIEPGRDRYMCLRVILEDMNHNGPYLAVESLMNMILAQTDHTASRLKYFRMLHELLKLYPTEILYVIQQAVDLLFQHIPLMNIVAVHRFAEWLIFFSSNAQIDYTWILFEEGINLPTYNPKRAFIQYVLTKLTCISDVSKKTPLLTIVNRYEIQPRVDCYEYKNDCAGVQYARILIDSIKGNKSNCEIILNLENSILNNNKDVIHPMVQTILRAGHINPTHTAHTLKKYISVFQRFITDSITQYECIRAIYDFWRNDTTRVMHSIQILEENRILTKDNIIGGLLKITCKDVTNLFFGCEIVNRYITMSACHMETVIKAYKDLKSQQKSDEIIAATSTTTLSSDALAVAKTKKTEAKRNFGALVQHIVQEIAMCAQATYENTTITENKSALFVWLLQHIQAVLFTNYPNISESTELLKKLMELIKKEEHIIEIINRFKSMNE